MQQQIDAVYYMFEIHLIGFTQYKRLLTISGLLCRLFIYRSRKNLLSDVIGASPIGQSASFQTNREENLNLDLCV